MVVETEKRRSLRPVVKRAPFQYPVPTSKYKPKPGFRHRASFRTKDELREEIFSLKQEIVILSSKLQASIKTQVALKRKLNFEMCPKIGTKRKAEEVGENTPPKKVYKIGTSKNVIKNPNKRKSELCDNNDKSDKRKKPNSQVEKNSESNITLQDHLTNVIEKATMSNKAMWDSLRLNEKDDDSVDDEVLIVPTTSTNNIESLLNMNEQDDDIVDDIEDEVIFVPTPEKSQRKSLFNCSKCDSQFQSSTTLNDHIYQHHIPSKLTKETKASPLSKQVKQEMFDNVDLRATLTTLSVKDLNKVLQNNKQLMNNLN